MKVPEAQPFLRSIAPFVRGINKLIQRMTLSGLEHIPRSGPAVIVANHTGYFDAMIIGEAVMKVGRAPHFVAGSNFFKVPGVAFVLRGVHAVKVTRETTNAKDSLDGIRDILDNGGVVLLFPEGGLTRDPDMWPMRGKTGIARIMATHPDVPVIPCAHWGNEHLLNPWDHSVDWRHIGPKTRTKIVFGAPLVTEVSDDPDYDELTSATAEVIDAIEELLIPMRQENPIGFSTEPRAQRWDRRRDGDPLNDEYEMKRAMRKAKKARLKARFHL